ncbi:MAG: hypothetical protein JNL43_05355 [Flavobacteriales bacterium]|nr:hypothetical protein [Flavobacteriales bacterium]
MNALRRSLTERNLWLFLVCAFLAWVTYHLKVATTPAWMDGTLEWVHKQLVALDYVNNEQSRLLQYGIPEALVRVCGISVRSAYTVQRLIFTTLALSVFAVFLRRWLKPGAGFVCVVLYALLIAYSARNDLQESAPLLGLTFIGALWALREKRDLLFAVIVWIGGLNNETMLFLPFLYLLVHADRSSLATTFRVGFRALLLGLPAILTVAAIRYIFRDRPYLGGGWHLEENLMALGAVLLFFGTFWALALRKVNALPIFFQRALISIPFFLIPNLIVGVITETRLLLPLAFFVLPAALWTWMPEEQSQELR